MSVYIAVLHLILRVIRKYAGKKPRVSRRGSRREKGGEQHGQRRRYRKRERQTYLAYLFVKFALFAANRKVNDGKRKNGKKRKLRGSSFEARF